MASITPWRAFKWTWIACAALGGTFVLIGVVSPSIYTFSGGVMIAVVWGPVLAALASTLTWGIRLIT